MAAAFDAISAELVSLDESPREVAPFTDRFPGFDAEAGYRAARHLHASRVARGWRPCGRKIGFTNRALWPRYGVAAPIWGWIYDRTLVHAVGERAQVSLSGLVQPRIEPEIAFTLKAAPRAPEPESLVDAIECVAHAVEIVHCHHPGWKVRLGDCTAANGMHGRLVVGTPLRAEQIAQLAERLPRLELELWRGETLVDRGRGENVLGSPLAALAELVALLARDPDAPPLAAGEIVTTGVLTDAHPVQPGQTWRTRLAGLALPGLEIAFA